MRETTFEGKRNFNIGKNYHASIREAFVIDTEVIEFNYSFDANGCR